MTKDEQVEYWIKGAEDDFTVDESLYMTEKYNLSLFINRLVLKKC